MKKINWKKRYLSEFARTYSPFKFFTRNKYEKTKLEKEISK